MLIEPPPYGPHTEWPEGFVPLSVDDAMEAISRGLHLEAELRGRQPLVDMKLIELLGAGTICCAYAPDYRLIARPTLLAMMQRYN